TTRYLPEWGPFFQPTSLNRSNSLCFSLADWELHPSTTARNWAGATPAAPGFSLCWLRSGAHVPPYAPLLCSPKTLRSYPVCQGSLGPAREGPARTGLGGRAF